MNRERTLVILLLAGAIAFAALAFRTSWQDVHQYGGTDLRSRVVGARAMLAGENPYRLPPNSQLPESLQDVDRDRRPPLSRIMVPPTLLALYGVFAGLPYYPAQRLIWFALSWAALSVSIALLASCVPGGNLRLAFIAMAVVFVAASPGWRLHVERGQYYVFLLLLMCVAARRATSRGRDDWMAGACLGLAVALRPTLAVALMLFWILGWRRAAVAGTLAAAACVALTLPVAGISVWRAYPEAVGDWQNEVMFGDWSKVLPQPEKMFVDGADFRTSLSPRSADLTSLAFLHLVRDGLHLQAPPALWLALNHMLGLIAIAAPALFLWRRRAQMSAAAILTGSLMIAFLSEYFLVPIRYGYADVCLILPLALLLPHLWPRRLFLIAMAAVMLIGAFAISQGTASAIVVTLAWWTLLVTGYRMVLHSGDRAPIEAEGVAPGSLLGGSPGLNKKTTAE
jgi:hypothetical protein